MTMTNNPLTYPGDVPLTRLADLRRRAADVPLTPTRTHPIYYVYRARAPWAPRPPCFTPACLPWRIAAHSPRGGRIAGGAEPRNFHLCHRLSMAATMLCNDSRWRGYIRLQIKLTEAVRRTRNRDGYHRRTRRLNHNDNDPHDEKYGEERLCVAGSIDLNARGQRYGGCAR